VSVALNAARALKLSVAHRGALGGMLHQRLRRGDGDDAHGHSRQITKEFRDNYRISRRGRNVRQSTAGERADALIARHGGALSQIGELSRIGKVLGRSARMTTRGPSERRSACCLRPSIGMQTKQS
jgi:hypothetical protein